MQVSNAYLLLTAYFSDGIPYKHKKSHLVYGTIQSRYPNHTLIVIFHLLNLLGLLDILVHY